MDEERKAESEIFNAILKACNGHPYIRVLQVLVDSLVCTSAATGAMSPEQVVELVRIAYEDMPRLTNRERASA
jgi:hypothetical protein